MENNGSILVSLVKSATLGSVRFFIFREMSNLFNQLSWCKIFLKQTKRKPNIIVITVFCRDTFKTNTVI